MPSIPPPKPDLLGQTLGHFRVTARIGEGGMGVVYRATDERLRRDVALKVLPAEAMRDEARKRRFFREARSAAAVVHANVATVHEVDETGGHIYIAMELVEGVSLRQELARGRLSIGEAVRIARGIARALAKAHEKGIVHRDLKPDNVMLSEDREVKVLDFGLAKLLDPEEDATDGAGETHDTANRLIGTPAYMSPEQATGKPIDARTDVFSFGVILYEMLTGKRPFGGANAMETLVAIARDDETPASSIVALPPAVEQILVTCMRKKPADRYASGRELAAAIDAFETRHHSPTDLGSQPTEIAGTLPSADTITRESAKRSTRSAMTRLSVALLAAAGIGVVAWMVGGRGRDGAQPVLLTPASASGSTEPHAKPEAVALYDQAEREDREGRRDLSCADYARASDADTTYARPAIEAAMCRTADPRLGREFFHRAWAGRAGLPPNEVAFIEAQEPIFQRDPSDEATTLARLKEAEKLFPNDPRIHFYISTFEYALGSFAEALPEIETSIRLDPARPHVLEIHADHCDYSGDFDRGRQAIDQCLKLVPGEIGCLQERAWVEGLDGQCSAVEGDARRMLAVDPKFTDASQILANALYSQGSSIASVREILRRKRDVMPPEDRTAAERADEVRVAILAGDFVTAEKLARAWADAVKGSTVASDHGDVARILVMIDQETGRMQAAAADAAAYLDGRDGWDPNARFEDWAMSKEPTPYMLATRLHAGAITQASFDRELARTVERWHARAVLHLHDFIWIWAYAVPAETPEEARAALDARAKYERIPPYTPLTLVTADVGRTYYLAGRIDEALAMLQRATKDCSAVDFPMEHTRAHYFLGLAREARGDATGACAAYDVVRERWGSAKPKSVTMEKVAARWTALKCK